MSTTYRQPLRAKLRKLREQLPTAQREHAEAAIYQLACKLPAYQTAKKVAFYLAQDGELNPVAIIQHTLANHKIGFLPILKNKQLVFGAYTLTTQLKPNRYQIPEPITEQTIEPSQLDCVFVPLVGFDRQGNRLGMGGGFYDRSFAARLTNTNKPTLIGLAFSIQEIPTLVKENWDVPLDYVITENEIINCSRK